MRTIEHEGQTYVLKTDMETAIKDRISKVTTRAQEAEQQVRSLQGELEQAQKGAGISDTLAQQVDELREQLQTSNQRYERYQAISKHGMVDPDMVEAIEWSYERAQKDVPKKDRQSLVEWLDSAVQNPDQAPAILRPHLQALQAEQPQTEVAEQAAEQPTDTPLVQQPQAPVTNRGARAAQDAPDLLSRAVNDSEFYAQNREAIKKAWRSKFQ
jgi:DNA repair exonuclease SbcCD ATPase subunit